MCPSCAGFPLALSQAFKKAREALPTGLGNKRLTVRAQIWSIRITLSFQFSLAMTCTSQFTLNACEIAAVSEPGRWQVDQPSLLASKETRIGGAFFMGLCTPFSPFSPFKGLFQGPHFPGNGPMQCNWRPFSLQRLRSMSSARTAVNWGFKFKRAPSFF